MLIIKEIKENYQFKPNNITKTTKKECESKLKITIDNKI